MPLGPLTANASQELTADTTGLGYAYGLMVNADGTLRCRFRGDLADRDLILKSGVVYPFDVVNVTFSAGTATITKVWILRQGTKS